jgi:hypothetical protein
MPAKGERADKLSIDGQTSTTANVVAILIPSMCAARQR